MTTGARRAPRRSGRIRLRSGRRSPPCASCSTLVAAGLLALSPLLAAEEPKPLAAGDPAPAFSLPGSDGKTHSLADYAGKRVVVLAWFPKAFTGG